MKTTELNVIAQNQAAEVAAKAKADKEAAINEIVEGVMPCDILIMLAEVYEAKITPITDANDNIIGVNRPHEITGLRYAKMIRGSLIVGNDEAELEQDYINYRKWDKAYKDINGGVQRAFEACLVLAAAGLKPEKALWIRNNYYFILADQKKVIDEKGNTIVDLSDKDFGTAGKELIVSILEDKAVIAIK